MSKNYANEHPRNKKKNQNSNVKVASKDWSDAKQMWYNKKYLELLGTGLSDSEAMSQASKEAKKYKQIYCKNKQEKPHGKKKENKNSIGCH